MIKSSLSTNHFLYTDFTLNTLTVLKFMVYIPDGYLKEQFKKTCHHENHQSFPCTHTNARLYKGTHLYTIFLWKKFV